MPSLHELHLLRHAKSGWDDPSLRDHARPLASRGRSAVVALRSHLADNGVAVDLVLCSTAERARQTWDGVRGGVAGQPKVRFLDVIYEAEADALLALLRGTGEDVASVLVVGHNPALADLAAGLATDLESFAGRRLRDKYPTGGLASFAVGAWSTLGYGSADLRAFVRPRDLPPG